MSNVTKKTWDWLQDENAGTFLNPMRHGGPPALTPASYFRPFSNFFMDVERMFDSGLRSFGLPMLMGAPVMWNVQAFSPVLDIASNDNEYVVTVEVPGMEEKDIQLNISKDGVLTISGEKRQESEENKQSFERMECAYGAFQRTLTLPADADKDAIDARFKNGVLTITCPRARASKSQDRHIPIGSGRQEGSRAGTAHSHGSKKAA